MSSTSSDTGSPNSSGFPRFAGGETHLVYTWWNTNGTNVVRNLTFRRGKVHGNQGDEMIHGLPGDPTRFGNITWDTVELGTAPSRP